MQQDFFHDSSFLEKLPSPKQEGSFFYLTNQTYIRS
nr:MAG TPA: hypothetical protein [Caudoviricetes sp.]